MEPANALDWPLVTQPPFPHGLTAALALALAVCSGCGGGGGGANPDLVHAITVAPASAALCVGDTLRFTAVATNDAGGKLGGVAFHWISSAPNAVTVDSTGLARAVALGATAITASAQGVTSGGAGLDVPGDLVPEFVPDSAVLAPGDTMTLNVRLRRLSAGPVPQHQPVFTPFDSTAASLAATGLVTAKAVGRVSPALAACGVAGGGAVDVYMPPNAGTGSAYLWLSGPVEWRVRLPVRLFNYPRTGGGPAFQIASKVGLINPPSQFFFYVDTVNLAGRGVLPIDSIATTQVPLNPACSPPRGFALYESGSQTLTFSLSAGSLSVTSFAAQSGYTAVSGRASLRLRGQVAGGTTLDTLRAI